MADDVPPPGQAGPAAVPAGAAPSDRSLLRRFRGGQPDAATELYLRYAERLRALADKQCAPDLAPRLDPDDIVQSVFRTFFRRAAGGQYDVPEGEDLWKLFMVIALHKVRSAAAFLRAAKSAPITGGMGQHIHSRKPTDYLADTHAAHFTKPGLCSGSAHVCEMPTQVHDVSL